MAQVLTAAGGTVVAFRPADLRSRRPMRGAERADERGAILLFTGIRYERPVMAHAALSCPAASSLEERPDEA